MHISRCRYPVNERTRFTPENRWLVPSRNDVENPVSRSQRVLYGVACSFRSREVLIVLVICTMYIPTYIFWLINGPALIRAPLRGRNDPPP